MALISYSSCNNEIRIPIFSLFIFPVPQIHGYLYIYIYIRGFRYPGIDSCRDEERNLDLFIVSSLQKRRLSSVPFLIPIHSFSNDPVSSAFLPPFSSPSSPPLFRTIEPRCIQINKELFGPVLDNGNERVQGERYFEG